MAVAPDWRIIAGRSDSGSGVGVPFREIPYGAVDGTNRTFRLTYTPLYGYAWIQLNGVVQNPFQSAGSGAEFTLAGNIITYAVAPQVGDLHWVWYFRGGPAATPRTPGRARQFENAGSDGDRVLWAPSGGAAAILRYIDDMALGLWLKLESGSSGRWIMANCERLYSMTYGLQVSGTSDNWNITYQHEGATTYTVEFTAGLRNDKWYYIGFSRSGTSVTLYKGDEDQNLTIVGTGIFVDAPNDSGFFGPPRLGFGVAWGRSVDQFNGTLEEHYIWHRAISAGEHAAALAGSPSATNLGLACQMGNNPEIDYSSNGYSGEVTGTTLVQGHR